MLAQPFEEAPFPAVAPASPASPCKPAAWSSTCNAAPGSPVRPCSTARVSRTLGCSGASASARDSRSEVRSVGRPAGRSRSRTCHAVSVEAAGFAKMERSLKSDWTNQFAYAAGGADRAGRAALPWRDRTSSSGSVRAGSRAPSPLSSTCAGKMSPSAWFRPKVIGLQLHSRPLCPGSTRLQDEHDRTSSQSREPD